MEHRETLEEFLSQLDFDIPDTDSKPVSEALAKARLILEGTEWLTSLERKWIDRIKYDAIKYLPQANDLTSLYLLANELADSGLPRVTEILRAISYGMAYQAWLDKHHESTDDGAATSQT